MQEKYSHLRCWAQVDLDALAHNAALIRRKAGSAGVMAVVKADAYGHGDTVIAPYFASLGADWFAVSCLAEAMRLRRIGIRQPILILGYTAPQEAARLAQLALVQSIPDESYALALEAQAAAAGCTVQAHLAMDTGMGRIGFSVLAQPQQALRQMLRCCALPHLRVSGAFTHFSVADSAAQEDVDYTQAQQAAFAAALDGLRAAGVMLTQVHCCNSAALFADAAPHYDLVRPGIVQYGLPPSPEYAPLCKGLRPALSLKATVAMVKPLKSGQYVSYGRTFCAQRDMTVATVTAGYADGYPRSVSNRAVCSVHGRPAPQIGNVCMDQLMLDVTDIPNVQPGDEVTLFGSDPADSIDTLAARTGTINYTIICNLSRRVPRLYLKNGVVVDEVDYLENDFSAQSRRMQTEETFGL